MGCWSACLTLGCCGLRVRGAQPPGSGSSAGVLLAGGADDGTDVEVSGSSRKTHLLP